MMTSTAVNNTRFNGEEFSDAEAIRYGVTVAKESGLMTLIMESDVKNVVNMVSGKGGSRKWNFLCVIRHSSGNQDSRVIANLKEKFGWKIFPKESEISIFQWITLG